MNRKIVKFLAVMLSMLLLGIAVAGCTDAGTPEAIGFTELTEGEDVFDVTDTAPETDATAETDITEEELVAEEVFASWNEEAPALQTLIEFVESTTDVNSPDYIPVERRIAVFDMDGTIYAELFPTYFEYYAFAWHVLADPNFKDKADQEMIDVATEIREGGPTHTYASDMAVRHGTQAARSYAGMSLQDFNDYCNSLFIREADGFTGMTYGEAFYAPIVEVIEYLQDNDFEVYVVSGSDRYLCRALFEGVIDIPDEHFIGMDVGLETSSHHGEDGLNYDFEPTDELVRTDVMTVKNLKMNKVTAIAKEIGKQPVISFGNTSGDTSMHLYTISNNPYKSVAFMLIADDDVRDYGHPEKAADLREQWEGYGFNVISMKNDFATIYGEGVEKTGKFRWTEELGGTPEEDTAEEEN